jgi:uncharacterized membrane protein YdbT with pleckstrin-like domain
MTNAENIQAVLHPSWACFTRVYIIGLIVLAVGAAAGSWGIVVIAFLATPLIAFLLRRSHEYTITDQRIIARNGLIARNTQELALNHIRAINVRQSIADRLMGIGHIEITSAADTRGVVIIEGISNPVRIKEEIRDSMIEKTR